MASRFSHSTTPYVLVDGTQIANNWTDLTNGNIAHAINLTESGATYSGQVWTGSEWTGLASPNTCSAWKTNSSSVNGTFGLSTQTNVSWSFQASASCDQVMRVYCFQQ